MSEGLETIKGKENSRSVRKEVCPLKDGCKVQNNCRDWTYRQSQGWQRKMEGSNFTERKITREAAISQPIILWSNRCFKLNFLIFIISLPHFCINSSRITCSGLFTIIVDALQDYKRLWSNVLIILYCYIRFYLIFLEYETHRMNNVLVLATLSCMILDMVSNWIIIIRR